MEAETKQFEREMHSVNQKNTSLLHEADAMGQRLRSAEEQARENEAEMARMQEQNEQLWEEQERIASALEGAQRDATAKAAEQQVPVLRVFPPCALISHAQGSSGVVDNRLFAWRGHTKSLTTRARPSPDLAVCLE